MDFIVDYDDDDEINDFIQQVEKVQVGFTTNIKLLSIIIAAAFPSFSNSINRFCV